MQVQVTVHVCRHVCVRTDADQTKLSWALATPGGKDQL